MTTEEDNCLHKLVISNPVMSDMGKYACEINGVITSAYLDVEGKAIHPQGFQYIPFARTQSGFIPFGSGMKHFMTGGPIQCYSS